MTERTRWGLSWKFHGWMVAQKKGLLPIHISHLSSSCRGSASRKSYYDDDDSRWRHEKKGASVAYCCNAGKRCKGGERVKCRKSATSRHQGRRGQPVLFHYTPLMWQESWRHTIGTDDSAPVKLHTPRALNLSWN